jgi:hypothetical protein
MAAQCFWFTAKPSSMMASTSGVARIYLDKYLNHVAMLLDAPSLHHPLESKLDLILHTEGCPAQQTPMPTLYVVVHSINLSCNILTLLSRQA